METESQASFSIGKETGELAVMETIRMDDMDLFEMVNHFFNREREVIQNPLAPERGAAPEALPQAPAPTEVAHPAPDQKERAGLRRDIQTWIREQLHEHCEKGKGRLSVHFPEMTEI
jgi:hypothetical protein